MGVWAEALPLFFLFQTPLECWEYRQGVEQLHNYLLTPTKATSTGGGNKGIRVHPDHQDSPASRYTFLSRFR